MRFLGFPFAYLTDLPMSFFLCFTQKKSYSLLYFLLILIFFGQIQSLLFAGDFEISPGSKWRLIEKKNKISIYARNLENSGLLAVKAVTVIDAEIFKVAELLRDIDAQKKWRTMAGKSMLIKKINDQHLVFYNELNLDWPLEDRYFFLEATVNILTDQAQAVIDVNAINEDFTGIEKSKGIRLKKIHAQIILQYISENKTGIIYQLIADPEGNLPHFIVNLFNKEYLYNDLHNLKKLAQDPKYETAAQNSAEYKMIRNLAQDPEVIRKVIKTKLIEYTGNRGNIELLMKNKKFVNIVFNLRGEIGEIAFLGEGSIQSSIDIAKVVLESFLREYNISEIEIQKIINDTELSQIIHDEKSGKKVSNNRFEKIILKYFQENNPSWEQLKKDFSQSDDMVK